MANNVGNKQYWKIMIIYVGLIISFIKIMVIKMKKTCLGVYPKTAEATPLYGQLLLGGYDVYPLESLQEVDDLDLIIIDLDFLLEDLGELFATLRNKPVLLASDKGQANQYAAEWGVMGVLGKNWDYKDLQLVIDFFVIKNQFYPRREFALTKTEPAPINVLLIEDNNLTADLIIDALASVGRIIHASNLDEARKILTQQKCDLILLDLFLPDGNGLDLLQEIKRNPIHELIPILVLSINDELRDKLKAFELGASDYLTKPFHIAELLARVKALSRGKQEQEVLLSNLKQMSTLAELDGLTGLYNHRFFTDYLRYRFYLARDQGVSIGMLMMDVDNFKVYNDTFGHLAGDEALKQIGQIISSTVRGEDVSARYGGEEFAALLWGVTEEQALNVAERIRQSVESHLFTDIKGGIKDFTLTISIGVVTTPATTPKELIKRADEALYLAKQTGRNRIVVWKKEEGNNAL